MNHPPHLDATEMLLKNLALKYANCRHGCLECFCTLDARAELGRIVLIEEWIKESKPKEAAQP